MENKAKVLVSLILWAKFPIKIMLGNYYKKVVAKKNWIDEETAQRNDPRCFLDRHTIICWRWITSHV